MSQRTTCADIKITNTYNHSHTTVKLNKNGATMTFSIIALVISAIGDNDLQNIVLQNNVLQPQVFEMSKNGICWTGAGDAVSPAKTGHSPNAVSMLGQRRRRWPNIETALGERLVFGGILIMRIMWSLSHFTWLLIVRQLGARLSVSYWLWTVSQTGQVDCQARW